MMFGVQTTKEVVTQLLPPLIISALQWARTASRRRRRRAAHEKSNGPVDGVEILRQARRNFEEARSDGGSDGLPPTEMWTAILEKNRAEIRRFSRIKDVITYAQTPHVGGFENRELHPEFTSRLYEKTLRAEFPHFSNLIDSMGDSIFSREATLVESRGRLVSDVFFLHLRYVLQCLTYVKEPRIICEIGGGYGGLARLWLENPIYRPDVYLIVDFPESLFFAEVFIRANFKDLPVLYVTEGTPLDPGAESQYTVILCPIHHLDALSEMNFDLIINTGSLQEMNEESVKFWMEWISLQRCRWFYSQNSFAQPLSRIGIEANIWSPRLDASWTARLQRVTPPLVRMQSGSNYAEILAEKVLDEPLTRPDALARYELLKGQAFDNQNFLESMDIVRRCPDEDIMWDLLQRSLAEMQATPKEVYYLGEYLAEHASAEFHTENRARLIEIREELHQVRSNGIEARQHMKRVVW